jgi:hypothetical protein
MAEKFPAVELVKTGLHLPPKPYIVVKIMLDELLHVLIRASRDFRCNTVKLRLQFRGKVYFHVPRVGKTGAGVKDAGLRIKTGARLACQVCRREFRQDR